MNKKKILFLILTVAFLILSLLFSLFIGYTKITLPDLFKPENTTLQTIFLQIRLPRTIIALITGMLLAASGSIFQLYFQNPLAEPGIIGISSGATLGAVIVSIVFSNVAMISLGAFLGALLSGGIITFLSLRKSGNTSSIVLLLCGTVLGTFYSSITSIIITLKGENIQAIYGWLMGSFSGKSWTEIRFILIPLVLSLIFIVICGSRLDLLSGGENTAQALGVNTKMLRNLIIVTGSLTTSIAVCLGGTIGFVGLIAPHVTRKLFSSKSKVLIPLSMLFGGILTLLADTIARIVIPPAEIPVGTITALIGAPFFISLIFSSRGNK